MKKRRTRTNIQRNYGMYCKIGREVFARFLDCMDECMQDIGGEYANLTFSNEVSVLAMSKTHVQGLIVRCVLKSSHVTMALRGRGESSMLVRVPI